MEKVDYLIIGAGMAGITLSHFLCSERRVLLDPQPGRYKIGESIIPELFYNDELRKLLPEIRKLASYTPKLGSIFMTEDEVASFPLPPELTQLAMHIERSELENLMRSSWGVPVQKERVEEIDLDSKVVVTDKGIYQVGQQIIDCSGPAMVLATLLGQRVEILPAHAVWSYYDVVEVKDSLFFEDAKRKAKRYMRFDVPSGRILPSERELPGWRPSHTTILKRLEEGIWMWQIPLFNATRLSVGIVSRRGRISSSAFFDLVQEHHAPHYVLKPRPLDYSSPYNRLHRRHHFAQRAAVASTQDYILVADAFAFADPVYSVGTGLAVNKAIQVAALLNEGGWCAEKSKEYNEKYEVLIAEAVEAFNFWYSGALLHEDRVASHIQRQFLCGEAFPGGIPHHYGQQLRGAMPDGARGENWRD